MSFNGLPAGAYNVGVACIKQDASFVPLVERYWSAPLTITTTPTGFDYAYGAVPAAPVISNVAPSNGTLDVTFTHAASVPATTGYTLTASSAGSVVATANLAAGATTGQLTGLTNGTTYDIALFATNSVGDSPAATSTGTPGVAAYAAPVVTTSAAGGGSVNVNWTTPPGSPTGYTLTISPAPEAPEAATFNLAAGVNTQLVTGLLPGTSYTATVQATYPAPFTGNAGVSGSFSGPSDALIFQEITVTRPEGALVLTQQCGAYGALDAEPIADAFPGFPYALGGVGPDQASGGVTAPTIAGGGPDPQFGNYPYPAPVTYPTTCGLDLGTATFVNSGTLAGEYYAADGRLNQVTVVDTRDVDSGWTVNGVVEDFVGSGTAAGQTFSGDYLGWTPKVNGTSATQVVQAGPPVQAGTGVNSGSGLTTSKVLAETTSHTAPANGLGIAKLDARIKLLIPSTADAGDYSATLSITAA